MSLSPNVIELLRALADGKQIQWRVDGPEEWGDCDAEAALHWISTGRETNLRVKPDYIQFECRVPRPESAAPGDGTVYYVPDLSRDSCVSRDTWDGGVLDLRVMERGLVHLTYQAAYRHAHEMLKGTALPRRFVAEPSRPEY